MTVPSNLARQLEEQLPAELRNLVQAAGEVAARQQQKLYLVGGVVRDLLLGRRTLDLDLVVEGDALRLVARLPRTIEAKITLHHRFGTAKLQWQPWSVDFTTARAETYARPGALPRVTPSSISEDLFRRDFTINAMAIHLNPEHYGKLIDLHGGRQDLEQKLIRVLHEKSFVDDATRIWRALRYEQRLDFHIEADTLQWLSRDIPRLDTISGDRIRYEVECILQEERPEKVLRRAAELGVLRQLHPSLPGNGWLAEKFEQARQMANPPPPGLYLALLAYRLKEEQAESLISYLRFPKPIAQILRDTVSIKAKLTFLTEPAIRPSRLYRLLHGYSMLALTANSLAADSPTVRQHVQLFLSKLRYVKPALRGDDLIRLGIPAGPRIKEMLERLRDARLEGEVTSKQAEEEVVKSYSTRLN